MTRHEQLTKKIALLRDTAMKCADYGSTFYEVWFRNSMNCVNLGMDLAWRKLVELFSGVEWKVGRAV